MPGQLLSENLVNEQVPLRLIKPSAIIKDDAMISDDITWLQIQPTDGGPYGFESNGTILFKFDSNTSYIDMSRSTIEYDLVNLGATAAKLDGNAHTPFSRIQLRTKYGCQLDDDAGYNARVLMERQMTVGQEYCNTHWTEFDDNLITAEASKHTFTSTASTNLHFCIIPALNVIKQEKILPLPLLGGLELELTMESSPNMSSGPDESVGLWQVKNVKYNLCLIPVVPEFIAEQRLAMRKGKGPVLNYARPYHIAAKKWDATANSLAISRGVSSATAILGRFYLSGDVSKNAKRYLTKSQYPS